MLLIIQLLTAGAQPELSSGTHQLLRASPPRIEARIKVDGVLDEPVWQRAARLGDFSQYSPSDGRPAEQETEVLVWYSPAAIYFGVRAHAEPGTVRAHLTDRDRATVLDDYIEIQLGTFNDRRSAFVFAVNPLGVQSDGALVEGTQRSAGATNSDKNAGREQADLSQDYTFDSKGRVTDYGYELEVRVPFKSLRYQSSDPQDWSLQIIRKSAASGREDTWAPARRDAASFLAQHGELTGLTGIRPGLVLELNPIVTSSVRGAPTDQGWDYSGGRPDFGGNLKWGMTTNLTLNGTVNPDFSQVESDAGQVSPDPRRALFFAEKRPFFLDGLEYFTTPSQMIYSRRIAAPVAAAKVTGKVSGTSFGVLSAVDGLETSISGLDHPVYTLLRVLTNVGGQSRLGMAYTDKIDGGDYNRVGEVDGRLVFGGINNLSFYGAVSRTRQAAAATTTAPMWFANFTRSGRTFGLQASFQAVSDQFRAQSGFVSQGDITQAAVGPSLTFYGRRGAALERFTGSVTATWTWAYTDWRAGAPTRDRQYWFSTSSTLRGGWTLGTIIFLESFGFDERLFRNYAVEVRAAGGAGRVDTIPYGPKKRIPSASFMLRAKSPELAGFSFDGFFAVGHDVDYFEWSPSTVLFSNAGLTYRPTEKLRFEGSLPLLIHYRRSDGTRVDGTAVPRLKVEYQVSRSIFLRVVGEYRSAYHDDLRDDARTSNPILIKDPDTGVYRRELALSHETNSFNVDWLFSYHPTPGTVFFAGYGSSLAEDQAFRFRGLRRLQDGFFTKFSYLFRL